MFSLRASFPLASSSLLLRRGQVHNSFSCYRTFSQVARDKPRTGIYAGSFDPPSSGHLDIIERGTQLVDKLYVGIAVNSTKKPIFSTEHRTRLLKKITAKFQDKVEIVTVEGLLALYAEQNNIDFFVRGIRSFSDFDSEFTMGIINRRLAHKETIFLQASSNRVHISSSLIRELSMYESKLDNFVPNEIEREVYEHLFNHYKTKRVEQEEAAAKV